MEKAVWTRAEGWKRSRSDGSLRADLVLYFASPSVLADSPAVSELAALYPGSALLGCSTGGEISDQEVLDDSLVASAIQLDATRLAMAETRVHGPEGSEAAGHDLAQALQGGDLRCVFVLSDGLQVNGSALVRGLRTLLAPGVIITGGLAGDGARFGSTAVGGRGAPQAGVVAAVGFYGERLQVGHGSVGGWDAFGPERMVTRSNGNVLLELDGQPALDLYKRYLGPEAQRLPSSALLFPLSIRRRDEPGLDLVRTIVGIDEKAKSMVFAGDVPEGSVAQLMRGSFNGLVDGAAKAAENALLTGGGDKLAVLVSCIGRKLLLGQRIADEVEAAAEVLGQGCLQVGFYSYGEISPHHASGVCDLHNQTMTITTFAET